MEKRKYLDAEAVLLSIDLKQCVDRKGWHWTVEASRPGRSGAYSRTWDNPHGRLDSDQAQDLSAWVASTAHSALVAWGGVQEALDA